MYLTVLSYHFSARQSLLQRRSRGGVTGQDPPRHHGEKEPGRAPHPPCKQRASERGTTPGRCPATLKHPNEAAKSHHNPTVPVVPRSRLWGGERMPVSPGRALLCPTAHTRVHGQRLRGARTGTCQLSLNLSSRSPGIPARKSPARRPPSRPP